MTIKFLPYQPRTNECKTENSNNNKYDQRSRERPDKTDSSHGTAQECNHYADHDHTRGEAPYWFGLISLRLLAAHKFLSIGILEPFAG